MGPHQTRNTPCEKCRKKHLKCDGEAPCTPCSRAGAECTPVDQRKRLKWFTSAPETFSPKSHRLRGRPKKQRQQRSAYTFVAECPSGFDEGAREPSASNPSTPSRRSEVTETPLVPKHPLDQEQNETAGYHHDVSKDWGGRVSMSYLLNDVLESSVLARDVISSDSESPEFSVEKSVEFDRSNDHVAPELASSHHSTNPGISIDLYGAFNGDDSIDSRMNGQEIAEWPESPASLGLQEACLLRCFVNDLATAFDTTDRARHYVTVVPLRARESPLLLNAICTASARYLLRLHSRTQSANAIKYHGASLPELSEESVIRYQNACISNLIEASTNPDDFSNDDALTAITILRYHEQVDVHLTGSDQEVFSRAVQAVFQTQRYQNDGFGSLIHDCPAPSDLYAASHSPLRRAACLIALRQEIWSVLLYRRPFRLAISALDVYPRFDDMESADDYEWANRILIWCAQIVRFCFGDETSDPDTQSGFPRSEQWAALKAFEYDWDTRQPKAFRPLYFQDRDPNNGQYFPQIWQTSECQIIALQHIELGRIILAGYESKLQRLRLGTDIAEQAAEALFRRSTRRICGLALCHRYRQEAMTTAAVAVSMCGKYFHDSKERAAIVELVQTVESEHAWYVERVIESMEEAPGYSPLSLGG